MVVCGTVQFRGWSFYVLEQRAATIDTARWMELHVGRTSNHMHVPISAAYHQLTTTVNQPTVKFSLKANIRDLYIMQFWRRGRCEYWNGEDTIVRHWNSFEHRLFYSELCIYISVVHKNCGKGQENFNKKSNSSNVIVNLIHIYLLILLESWWSVWRTLQRLNAFDVYTECPGWNVPDFGKMFLTLKYTDITQNTLVYPKLNGYGDNGERSLKVWQLLHTYWLPNTY